MLLSPAEKLIESESCYTFHSANNHSFDCLKVSVSIFLVFIVVCHSEVVKAKQMPSYSLFPCNCAVMVSSLHWHERLWG